MGVCGSVLHAHESREGEIPWTIWRLLKSKKTHIHGVEWDTELKITKQTYDLGRMGGHRVRDKRLRWRSKLIGMTSFKWFKITLSQYCSHQKSLFLVETPVGALSLRGLLLTFLLSFYHTVSSLRTSIFFQKHDLSSHMFSSSPRSSETATDRTNAVRKTAWSDNMLLSS